MRILDNIISKKENDKAKNIILLACVFGMALILRLWNIHFGLPFFNHPDEAHYLPKAVGMLARLDFNPGYFHNPPLLTYIYAFFVAVYYMIWQVLGLFINLPAFKELWQNNPASFYILARAVSAVFGAASCLVIYSIGKKLFNKHIGLVSAVLLCFCFIHVRDSHYGVNDIAAVFFMLLAFNYIVDIWSEGDTKKYIFAGIFSGLAVAVKYNMGLIVCSFLAAYFLGKSRSWKKFSLYFVFFFLGFFLVCPWIILDMKAFWGGFVSQLKMAASPWLGGAAENSYFQFLKTILWGYGAIPFLFSFIGVVFLFIKSKKIFLLVIGFPLIYTILLGGAGLFFVRFTLPIIPFLCVLSACGIYFLSQHIGVGEGRYIKAGICMIVLLTILAAAQGAVFSVRHNLLIGREDTRSIAGSWIEHNLPAGSKIAIENYCPNPGKWNFNAKETDKYNKRSNQKFIVKDTWRYLAKTSIMGYREAGFTYIVTSDFIRRRYLADPSKYAAEVSFYNSLDGETEKVFSSGNCGGGVPFFLDEVYSPFWNIFILKEPGPCISIYRLKSL